MKWKLPLQKQWLGFFKQYKYIFLILIAGLILLLWPQENKTVESTGGELTETTDFDLSELEERIEDVLSKIEGAGKVSLVLTVKSGVECIYAVDSEYIEDSEAWEENRTTVLVSTGNGTEQTAIVKQVYPEFQGALVVCDGGDDPKVKLLITQAVSALTGLGTDKITVCH